MSVLLVQQVATSVIVCGLAHVCLAGTNQAATTESTSKAPRIVFDSTQYVATVTNAQSVTGSFTFHNRGNADLHIRLLEVGAYEGTLPTYQPVAPGETGTIALRLNIGGAKGTITKHVKYGTDDPLNPVIPLTFTVNVSTNATTGPAKK